MDGVRESDEPLIMWSLRLVNQCLQTSINYEVTPYFVVKLIVRGECNRSVCYQEIDSGRRQRHVTYHTSHTRFLDGVLQYLLLIMIYKHRHNSSSRDVLWMKFVQQISRLQAIR